MEYEERLVLLLEYMKKKETFCNPCLQFQDKSN